MSETFQKSLLRNNCLIKIKGPQETFPRGRREPAGLLWAEVLLLEAWIQWMSVPRSTPARTLPYSELISAPRIRIRADR